MQIILVAAAVASLLIKEWSTAVLLVLLTLPNAVVGLRQQGKAESDGDTGASKVSSSVSGTASAQEPSGGSWPKPGCGDARTQGRRGAGQGTRVS